MTSKQKIFFSSDWHLSHKNIIKICKRPFSSIEEMNSTIISNHNRIVGPNDLVYFLGDLCFGRVYAREVLKKIHGRIHYIYGNHDKPIVNIIKDHCEWSGGQKIISIEKKKFTLNHFPMLSWDGSHYGHFHLHGHCHASLNPREGALDVGIENAFLLMGEYKPFSLEEILKFIPEVLEKKPMRRTTEKISFGDSVDQNRKTAFVEDWKICPECRQSLPLKVIRCLAGYYIGSLCSCNFYETQESGLFSSQLEAEEALLDWMRQEQIPVKWKEKSS